MSCGCSNNINYPNGCGNSSCTSCSSTSCEQVVYTGPNLTCSGINNDDNLCVAIQKIDNILCNPSSATVTASNGLYKNLLLNDIRMGGPLTEVTTIGTSTANTLSLTGLATDQDPLYVLVQTNLGVVRKSLVSTITSSILAILTADNGLTYTSTNVQLGGPLIKPTTITAGSTNTLSIAGLVSNPSATYVVSVDNGTGLLTKTALSAIIPPTVTADNGLTKTSNNIQLGGTLLKDTTVDLSGYKLSLTDGVGPNNGIRITPGAFTDCVGCSPNCNPTTAYNWTTNVNDFYSKNLFHSVSRFDGNIGIGTGPDSNSSTCGNGIPLLVEKVRTSWNNTFSAGRGAAAAALTMQGALGTDTSNGEITSGLGGTLNVNPTTNTTLITNHAATYSGISGRISVNGNNGGLSITGQLAAFTSRSLFADQGGVKDPSNGGMSLQTYIGFQAESPQAYGGVNYTGTLTNAIGVKIEDQRSGMGSTNTQRLAGAGLITNSYGIVQGDQTNINLGKNEKNIFNGASAFNNNVVIGLNNLTNRYDLVTGSEVPTTRLFTYRNSGYTSEAITVASNSLLEMAGFTSNWGSNTACSLYAGDFDYMYWAPYNDVDVSTIINGNPGGSAAMTLTGHGSYLSVATPKVTSGGNMASNTAQVYSTNTSFQVSGVSSSGSTLTLPYLTDPGTGLTITAGSQITLVSGTGSFGSTINVFVNAIVSAVVPYQVSLKKYTTTSPTGGYSTFTPTAALINATIEVGLAGGSINKVIAYRAKGPVPYQYGGSLLNIDNAVGIQIDDQKGLINTTWNTSTQKSVGTLVDSYGILQLGTSDVNQLNGPLQLPSANTSIGTATLSGGTVTVSTTAAKTGSRIFISRNTPGGTPGHLSAPVASITNGVSFVINSSSGTDTSTVNWWVIQS